MANVNCQDVYDQVYKRVKSEGGSDLKAKIYANIAKNNCTANPEADKKK